MDLLADSNAITPQVRSPLVRQAFGGLGESPVLRGQHTADVGAPDNLSAGKLAT